jgi:hypothetical protein
VTAKRRRAIGPKCLQRKDCPKEQDQKSNGKEIRCSSSPPRALPPLGLGSILSDLPDIVVLPDLPDRFLRDCQGYTPDRNRSTRRIHTLRRDTRRKCTGPNNVQILREARSEGLLRIKLLLANMYNTEQPIGCSA